MNQIENNKENNSEVPSSLKRKLTRQKSILGSSVHLNTSHQTAVVESPSKKAQSVEQCNDDVELNKFEFEMNNGDYVIYEYCNELVRKVQETKERQIEYLEDISAELMKKIEAYKQETTQNYFKKSAQLKQVFNARLEKMRSKQLNLEQQKSLLNKSIFSDKFLQFKPTYSEVGSLKMHETSNQVDAKYNLQKIANLNVSTELAENLSDYVHYRYFENGDCLMAFVRYVEKKIDFMVLNPDKSIKVSKKTMNSFGDSFAEDIYVVENKLIYQTSNGKVDIYDSNLKLLNRFENKYSLNPVSGSDYECDCILHYEECLCNADEMVNTPDDKYRLIGACKSGLYLASKDYMPEIHVTDWSFKLIKIIKAPESSWPHEFTNMQYYKGKYYYLDYSKMYILDKAARTNIKVGDSGDIHRFEIDSNENLILFYKKTCFEDSESSDTKKLIRFYDLNGNLKFDLKLKNFNDKNEEARSHKKIKTEPNDDEEEDDEDEDDEYDQNEWVQAFVINKANQLCYFDRKSLQFHQVIYDDLDLNK